MVGENIQQFLKIIPGVFTMKKLKHRVRRAGKCQGSGHGCLLSPPGLEQSLSGSGGFRCQGQGQEGQKVKDLPLKLGRQPSQIKPKSLRTSLCMGLVIRHICLSPRYRTCDCRVSIMTTTQTDVSTPTHTALLHASFPLCHQQ